MPACKNLIRILEFCHPSSGSESLESMLMTAPIPWFFAAPSAGTQLWRTIPARRFLKALAASHWSNASTAEAAVAPESTRVRI
jgi:hypothetical protein